MARARGLIQHPLHQIIKAILLQIAGQAVDAGNESGAFRVALGVVAAIGHPAIAPGVLLIRLIPDVLLRLGDEHLTEVQGGRPAFHPQLPLAGENHMQMVSGPTVRVEGIARQALLHPAEDQKQIVALLLGEFLAAVFAGLIEHSLFFHASSFPVQWGGAPYAVLLNDYTTFCVYMQDGTPAECCFVPTESPFPWTVIDYSLPPEVAMPSTNCFWKIT